MSIAVSPLQSPSFKASIALNVVLVVTMFLAFLPFGTNVANARYCVQGVPLAGSTDLAQSGKIRPDSVAFVHESPASVVRGGKAAKAVAVSEQRVSFIRCVSRDAGLGG